MGEHQSAALTGEDIKRAELIRDRVERELRWKYGIIAGVVATIFLGGGVVGYDAVKNQGDRTIDKLQGQVDQTLKDVQRTSDDTLNRIKNEYNLISDESQKLKARLTASLKEIEDLRDELAQRRQEQIMIKSSNDVSQEMFRRLAEGAEKAAKIFRDIGDPRDGVSQRANDISDYEKAVKSAKSIQENSRFKLYLHFRQNSLLS